MSDPELGNRNFDAWAAEIRQQESSDNYGSDTGTHFGAYQMGSAALLAAGFQDKAGGWTALARAYGVKSIQDFLATPRAQDIAFERYTVSQYKDLRPYLGYIGRTIDGIKMTLPGMLAGARLVGPGGVVLYLTSNGRNIPSDHGKHPVPVTRYLKKFGGPSFHYDEKRNGFVDGANISSSGSGIGAPYKTPASVHAALGRAASHSVAPIPRRNAARRANAFIRQHAGASVRPVQARRNSHGIPAPARPRGRNSGEPASGRVNSVHASIGKRLSGRFSVGSGSGTFQRGSWAGGRAMRFSGMPEAVSPAARLMGGRVAAGIERGVVSRANAPGPGAARAWRRHGVPGHGQLRRRTTIPTVAPIGGGAGRSGGRGYHASRLVAERGSKSDGDSRTARLVHGPSALGREMPHAMHGDAVVGEAEQRRMGHVLAALLDREARLPPSGATGFDPRLTPTWAGQKLPG